jgi:hypothetical protein
VTDPLTDPDRLAVRDALEEIRAHPPRDIAPIGCLVTLPGFLILLVAPVAGRMLGWGRGFATAVLVIGVSLLAVGIGMWVGAPGLIRNHSKAAAEAALRQLEQGAEDRHVLLRAATLLLTHAHATVRGTTSVCIDTPHALMRLGSRAPLVVQVERHLLAEGQIYPVFTLEDEDQNQA